MGTEFDTIVLAQVKKEGFVSKKDKMELIPADSNEIQ
jgi:hypothetical protein